MKHGFFILVYLLSGFLLKASESWDVYIPDESFENYIRDLRSKASSGDHVAQYKLALNLRN
jgi:predicted DNA-binding protein (UPF0278 family)